MFNINTIMATVNKLYFAKPSFYQVRILGGNIPDASEDIMFYCCQVNVPGITIETAEENRYKIGTPRHYPKQKGYTEMNMTFYEAEYLGARNYFSQWANKVQNTDDFRMEYYENIIKKIIINQIDKTGSLVTYTCELEEAWPVSVGQLERGYDKRNIVPTFSVGFKFHTMVETFYNQPPLSGLNQAIDTMDAIQRNVSASGITTLSSLTNLINGK